MTNGKRKITFQMVDSLLGKYMTSKQKCDKLAKMLETVAGMLREPSLGTKVLEAEEPALQTLVAQLSIVFKRATQISKNENSSMKRTGKKTKEDDVSDDWPDIIDN